MDTGWQLGIEWPEGADAPQSIIRDRDGNRLGTLRMTKDGPIMVMDEADLVRLMMRDIGRAI